MWFNLLQHLLTIADSLFVALQAAAASSHQLVDNALSQPQDSAPQLIFRGPGEALLEERQVSFRGLNGHHEELLYVHDKLVCITSRLPRSERLPLTNHDSQTQ